MNFQAEIGLCLVNLGTPRSTDISDIKAYLKEFLNDPYVIDIPTVFRKILVNGIILNVRPSKTRHAYLQVWTPEGSPLLVLSKRQKEALKKETQKQGLNWKISLGMRYGEPSIREAIVELKDCQKIIVLPLYPQYALSSTETALQEIKKVADELGLRERIVATPPFYDFPGFIKSQASLIAESVDLGSLDCLLMSFHGLPERHVIKTDLSGGQHCLKTPDCCAKIGPNNINCYRAQCYATAGAIAKELGLPADKWRVSFQSRLTSRWIRPFTDEVLQEMPEQGVKSLAVVCPSFVTDCLETLEEIGQRARETFLTAGGTSFTLIPCVNDRADFASALVDLAKTTNSEV